VAVSPAEDVIRFGVFELDLKASQLTRYGTKLRLPQQPLQLLAVLLERPGETFTRTFGQAGTYAYLCSFHPYMTGDVVVSAN